METTQTFTARQLEAEIPRLRQYALSLTRDKDEANELVQQCLARALEKQHLWQPGTNLRAWLMTILHNQHVNVIRTAVREGIAVGLDADAPQLKCNPNQESGLLLDALDEALAQLPEEQRVVVLMVGREGMRYDEVAAVLRIPVGTVRSRLSRGRDALRELMGKEKERKAPSRRTLIRRQRARRHEAPAELAAAA
ncbi:MAG TPA: sigma-70 family RNA polymerase sigma factor [Candidatus Paceibacterota bacterium]|nr:sigma-70 family RNA polymerase sigma factor [Candidatus Paceibacterota bacterium]